MIVTCENCGKRHHIDPEQFREAMTTFQCGACNHVMTFSIRAANPADLPASNPEFIDLAEQNAEAPPSTSETPGEEQLESGLDETRSFNPEKPERLDMAEKYEEVTPSAPEATGEESSKTDLDEQWPFNPEGPEHLDLAEQDAEVTPSALEALGEEPPESDLDERWAFRAEEAEYHDVAEGTEETPPATPQAQKKETPKPAPRKRKRAAVQGNIFSLFLLVPLCLIIAALFIHRNSMETVTGFIMKEASQLVTKMAEHAIADKGRIAAAEVERYLLSHPDVLKEDFMQDPVLKGMGIQHVGNTGYTYLISMRTPIEVSALWLHPDKNIIGRDVNIVMRTALGAGYERWNRIQGVAFTQGTEAAGYYAGRDKREQYLVMVPVKGTAFFVASTAYLDEFTKPLIALQGRVNELTAAAARIMTIVLIAAALVIVLFFAINNYLLSGRITSVPDAADHSAADDVEVETRRTTWGNGSKVAPAIRRMQGGIQHAIKRFRERR